jgi:predicted DNA-binding ribbon-helix-helix protein
MDTHRTTILFKRPLYKHLLQVAKQRHVSLGHLVREACESQYGKEATVEERLRAVDALRRLSLPVSDVETMLKESVPAPDDLLPH